MLVLSRSARGSESGPGVPKVGSPEVGPERASESSGSVPPVTFDAAEQIDKCPAGCALGLPPRDLKIRLRHTTCCLWLQIPAKLWTTPHQGFGPDFVRPPS